MSPLGRASVNILSLAPGREYVSSNLFCIVRRYSFANSVFVKRWRILCLALILFLISVMCNLMFVGSLISNFGTAEFKSKPPEKMKQHARMLRTASGISGSGWLRSMSNSNDTGIFSSVARERLSRVAARLSIFGCVFGGGVRIGVEIGGGGESGCTRDRSSSESSSSSSVPLPGTSVADPKYA